MKQIESFSHLSSCQFCGKYLGGESGFELSIEWWSVAFCSEEHGREWIWSLRELDTSRIKERERKARDLATIQSLQAELKAKIKRMEEEVIDNEPKY